MGRLGAEGPRAASLPAPLLRSGTRSESEESGIHSTLMTEPPRAPDRLNEHLGWIHVHLERDG